MRKEEEEEGLGRREGEEGGGSRREEEGRGGRRREEEGGGDFGLWTLREVRLLAHKLPPITALLGAPGGRNGDCRLPI